jgi:hypothetical protein
VIIPLIPATNLFSLQSDLPRSSRHINDARRNGNRCSTTKITKEKKIPGRGWAAIIVKTVFIHQRTDYQTPQKKPFSFLCFVYSCTIRNQSDWTRGTNVIVCRIRQLQEPMCISVTGHCCQMLAILSRIRNAVWGIRDQIKIPRLCTLTGVCSSSGTSSKCQDRLFPCPFFQFIITNPVIRHRLSYLPCP